MKRETPFPHPHPHCLLCGNRNPQGLQLHFDDDGDGRVSTRFKGRRILQGYEGILHGGVIASLLDSAMTNCLFRQGIRAMTGELNIRYRHPVPCYEELLLRAQIMEARGSFYELKAELLIGEQIMARAAAKFIRFAG